MEPLNRSLGIITCNHLIITSCVTISESVLDWGSKILEKVFMTFSCEHFFPRLPPGPGELGPPVSPPLLEEVVVLLVNGHSSAISGAIFAPEVPGPVGLAENCYSASPRYPFLLTLHAFYFPTFSSSCFVDLLEFELGEFNFVICLVSLI